MATEEWPAEAEPGQALGHDRRRAVTTIENVGIYSAGASNGASHIAYAPPAKMVETRASTHGICASPAVRRRETRNFVDAGLVSLPCFAGQAGKTCPVPRFARKACIGHPLAR